MEKKVKSKKILVVDDEMDNRTTLRQILSKEGYQVVEAENADKGLEVWRKEKPDLVLLDIMMSGTPVSEVVPKMKGARIVYVSVVRISEVERENLLKNKNILGFIQKPYDIDDLIAKIKRFLR